MAGNIVILVFAFLLLKGVYDFFKAKPRFTANQLMAMHGCAMPILVLQAYPGQPDFEETAQDVRDLLDESQNPYGVPVIAIPFNAPVGDTQTVAREFSQYQILAVQRYMDEVEKWAAQKYKDAPEAAIKKIAGREPKPVFMEVLNKK